MCYYSKTMSDTRDAKEQEGLHVSRADGHAVLRGNTDGKTVCVMDKNTIHVENLRLSNDCPEATRYALRHMEGKPVSATFIEYHSVNGHRGYAADALLINGWRIHLWWLEPGTECYIGAKKMALETKLGVDEQALKGAALDHREPETIVDRVLAPRELVNSIRR